jgi:hypothetical protein
MTLERESVALATTAVDRSESLAPGFKLMSSYRRSRACTFGNNSSYFPGKEMW